MACYMLPHNKRPPPFIGRYNSHNLLRNQLHALLCSSKQNTSFYFVSPAISLYSTTPHLFPSNFFILYRSSFSSAHVLFVILLQGKINLLQNSSCLFLGYSRMQKGYQRYSPNLQSTLSLAMLIYLRFTPSFLLLEKSPIILISHNLSLQRSVIFQLHSHILIPCPSHLSTEAASTASALSDSHTLHLIPELPIAIHKGNMSSQNPNPIYACYLDYLHPIMLLSFPWILSLFLKLQVKLCLILASDKQ